MKFARNPGQLKWVARETRYHASITELLKRNFMIMLIMDIHADITLFQWGPQIFPKVTGGKVSL